ncbi:hypothetical protein PQC06_gp088 [Aeromonas phage LAh10]|uniref:Uncharacterized protein n=1 Tax=Aeromonas phage LAh10 TaxID=2591025 RepID=A0A514A166_9CAUD|nr:hypothetical protein PQC06_gp088 [Aeromonas phage LAh10]QDH47017.1 hypothetical protein LAh10_88 [Aeromonas phage LAh10]
MEKPMSVDFTINRDRSILSPSWPAVKIALAKVCEERIAELKNPTEEQIAELRKRYLNPTPVNNSVEPPVIKDGVTYSTIAYRTNGYARFDVEVHPLPFKELFMDLVPHTKTFTGLYECATISDMIAMAPFHTGKGDYFYVVETNKFYYFARKALLGNDIYNFPVVTDIIFEKMSGFHFPTSIDPAVDPQRVIIEDLSIEGQGEIVLLSGDKLDEESENQLQVKFPKSVQFNERDGKTVVNLSLSKKLGFDATTLLGKNLSWAGHAPFTQDFTGKLTKISDTEYTAELEFTLPSQMKTLESSLLVFEAELSNMKGDKKASSNSTFIFEVVLDPLRFRNKAFIATKAGSFYFKDVGRVTLPQGFLFSLKDDAENVTALPDSWILKGPFTDVAQMTYVEKLGLYHVECRVIGCDDAELSMMFGQREMVHPFVAGARMKDLSFDFAQMPATDMEPLFSAKLQLVVDQNVNHPAFQNLNVFAVPNPNEPWVNPPEYISDVTNNEYHRIISTPLIRSYGSTERFIAPHPGEWFELEAVFKNGEHETVWTMDLYHQLSVIECRTDLDLGEGSTLELKALVHPDKPNEFYIRDWFLKEGYYNKSLVQVTKTGFVDSPFADEEGKPEQMTKVVVLDKNYVSGTKITMTLPVGIIKDGLQHFNVVTVVLVPEKVYPEVGIDYKSGVYGEYSTLKITDPYLKDQGVPVILEDVIPVLDNTTLIKDDLPIGEVESDSVIPLYCNTIDEEQPSAVTLTKYRFKIGDKSVSIQNDWMYRYLPGGGSDTIPQIFIYRNEEDGTGILVILSSDIVSPLSKKLKVVLPSVGVVDVTVERGSHLTLLKTKIKYEDFFDKILQKSMTTLTFMSPYMPEPFVGNVLRTPSLPPYGKNPSSELTIDQEKKEYVLNLRCAGMNKYLVRDAAIITSTIDGEYGSMDGDNIVFKHPLFDTITPVEKPLPALTVKFANIASWYIQPDHVFSHKPPLLPGWEHELVPGDWDNEYFQPWKVVYRNKETGESVENTAANLIEVISYSVNGEPNSQRVRFDQEGVYFTNPGRVSPGEKVTVRAKFRAGTWEGEVKPTFVATITLTT